MSKKPVKKSEKIGLLVTMKARVGKEEEAEKFLAGGLNLANEEVQTTAWFAFCIGGSTFGIYDTFQVEFGRKAHLKGQVVKALVEAADDLFEDFNAKTSVQPVDLVATNHKIGEENKGLLVLMTAKAGKEQDVENFLKAGRDLVTDEPATHSWYALKVNDSTYGIFDTFADDAGRDAHLSGAVAAALMKNAPLILEGFEASAIQKIDIIASK